MTDGVANAGLVALIAIVPLVVLMLTSFVKVSVVLSLLRNAIGATDAPSGLVVMGLSLILTFFVMAPVAVQMVSAAATQPAKGATPTDAPGPTKAPMPTNGSAPPTNAPTTNAPANAPTTNAPTNAQTANAPTTNAPTTNTPTTSAPTTNALANAPTSAPTTNAPTTSAPTTTAAPTSGAPTNGAPTNGAPGTTAPQPVDVLASLRAVLPADRRADVDAVARAIEPLRVFLARHASARDKATFVELGEKLGQKRAADELAVLAPAFVTTELREAFAIAVLIFVPFLVIDLLVGLGLAALGLSTTSPQTVALPIKLLLFVAVDGWRLLIDSLLRGYA